MDHGEDLREQLSRMSRNFAGLAGQMEIVGQRAGKALTALGAPISRLAGKYAAWEDWGEVLWPSTTDEGDDDE